MAAERRDTGSACPPSFAYLFEAKGVQRWLFDSGPLRDLIGASDLVAGLAASSKDDLLEAVLAAAGLADPAISRRAGGAFCLHSPDKAALARFRALWRLAVSLRCPGLEFVDALTDQPAAETASVAMAYKSTGALRDNGVADLPPTGHPFTALNPRTGRLATRILLYGSERTLVDVVSETQREHAEELATTFVDTGKHDRVALRFLSEEARQAMPPFVFPRNLEQDEGDDYKNPAFPFATDDHRIAVLHADLSGLGQIFQRARKSAKCAEDIRVVAEAIERVVEGAAQDATATLLKHARALKSKNTDETLLWVLPARPVVLGGDDVTILVRADLAFRFAETLLIKIEERSEQELGAFAGRDLGVEYLSACAGLAIVKSGQPFLMANDLSESLVKTAKAVAKNGREAPYPSFLAFHVAQSTLRENYKTIVDRELTTPGGVKLTGNPYRVGSTPAKGERSWEGLVQLARALEAAPEGRGKLIEAARLLFDEPGKAKEVWDRWREVLGREAESERNEIDLALETLDLPNTLTGSIGAITDALELVDFGAIWPEERT